MAHLNSASSPVSGQARFFAQVELAIIAADLSPLAKAVYTALARYRNAQNGLAWPGRDTLAAMLKIHPDSVSRCTRQLEKAGFITIAHRAGNRCYYSFPWIDARLADRKAKAASTPSTSIPQKPGRKRRERLPVETLPEAGSDPAVRTSCARSLMRYGDAKENPPQTPPLEPASAEPEIPRGEIPASQPPGIAPEARQAPEKAKPAQARLAFPEGLPALVCIQLGKMLSSTPEAVAQELLDEMAYNARCHGINSPCAYIRRLLNLHRQSQFTPEVAHFERERRKRQQATEAIRQRNERVHLQALAEGKPPPKPTMAPIVRTPEDEAIAKAHLAEMRAMLHMKPSRYNAGPS